MISITKTDWQTSETALRKLRETVFMQEQHVSAADEWDGKDDNAIHYLVTAEGQAIGCARLLMDGNTKDGYTGKIGRVAILPAWRRQHIATKLLQFIINNARETGLHTLSLDAQTTVTGLYKKLGFTAYGDTFMDAGILHQGMSLQLE